MFELSKQFRFEAAHTLHRVGLAAASEAASRRIHGHSYRADVTLRGERDAQGMVLDLERVAAALAHVRALLDHQFLDDVAGLGPATLENLAAFIWAKLTDELPGLTRVAVYRDSEGDACVYTG
ncbi:MAG TPA: 6-carboxytetrahydropterin synthase [Acidiphilium sp.]|nr:MAG: 6-carboxytetrahydropterin synthase QueD [Acidiphilium sp. 21-60-14]OYV90319.1 MAG: 6-carboxytetrahydropterin synthase QueD [Acidiphilium sp. 37-60-79]OZB38032.1 MAG: 6-carboxytetrahydropterin synthase QueD [Acidiphilium sp. 34-60-192]HQT88999.1 6-carboxytetrahydropterin synthase [Acidiphilium sp.]HQU24016.1 6-carboxytetrahydropterin synthase [Acidiphilium sp.]